MTALITTAERKDANEAYDLVREQDSQYDAIINIQGDEPYIRPEQIYQVIQLL